ncbi:MAG: HAD family phosphatase [Chloroflexi bacterium]|nr:HAD family phosphatase [Chloroflexota bacterium]
MSLVESNEKSPAIVFDLGGVLIDWNPRHLYRKLLDGEQAVEEFLLKIGFTEWNHEQDKGRPFDEAVVELSAKFPEYRELIEAYDLRYAESLAGPIQPTVEIFQQLKHAGHPLYALSNWNGDKFRMVRRQFPFLDAFQAIVISGEVGLAKPDPRIFDVLLEKIHREAGDCLFIDDAEANIATALRMGFETIHFKSPEQLRDALRGMGLIL